MNKEKALERLTALEKEAKALREIIEKPDEITLKDISKEIFPKGSPYFLGINLATGQYDRSGFISNEVAFLENRLHKYLSTKRVSEGLGNLILLHNVAKYFNNHVKSGVEKSASSNYSFVIIDGKLEIKSNTNPMGDVTFTSLEKARKALFIIGEEKIRKALTWSD